MFLSKKRDPFLVFNIYSFHWNCLLLLLLFRNIQVDNPVAVLDQEEAKKFLTGKAEDKYLFFMKATELERVDRTFHSIVESIEEMKNINERSTESLQPASEHVSNLRKMWKEHQELKKLEDKHMKSCAEFAWAVYTEFDTNLEKSVVVRLSACLPACLPDYGFQNESMPSTVVIC